MFRLLLIALFFLASCSRRFDELEMMPAPVLFDQSEKDLLRSRAYLGKSPYQGILYVTDRAAAASQSKTRFYENKRGSLLRVGIGQVDYSGTGLGDGLIRKIPVAGQKMKPVPGVVSGIRELGYLSSAMPYGPLVGPGELKGLKKADREFAKLINGKLAVSDLKEVTIYIHGVKNVFENPLLVASELWSFMGNDGVCIGYSWPATPNFFAYLRDIETARLSGGNLRRFIRFLSRETNARKINIVAHSAGTRVTLTALHELALVHQTSKERERLRLGQVSLIASDYDPEQFASAITDGILDLSDATDIYISSDDSALGIARQLFTFSRLGQRNDITEISPHARTYLSNHPRLSFIDVSSAPLVFAGSGHSYHRRSPWVSNDLIATLRSGAAPSRRGLVRDSGKLVWTFPEDYPARSKSLRRAKR